MTPPKVPKPTSGPSLSDSGPQKRDQNPTLVMSDRKPKDLLVRFGSGNVEEELRVKEEPMEVELNLGLSLGGTFGVDKSKGLLRASSISAFSFLPEEEKVVVVEKGESKGGLMRTCSLPVETGEERRKRKEMQCLRRMEAKRKRFEKRGWKREGGERFQVVNGVVRRGCCPVGGRIGEVGGCSTSSPEYDCRPMEGLDISSLGSSSAEARSPADPATHIDRTASLPPATHIDRTVSLPPATPNSAKEESTTAPSKLVSMGSNGSHEMVNAMREKMPCVSTRGDGPNGKQVKGFLYRYAKGEEVRIVCVCCGSFLTPAEFVKHGGGGDVEFPLRHIVVYPS